MTQIPDDPIIRCMEWTGYPPWMQDDGGEDEPRMFLTGYEDD